MIQLAAQTLQAYFSGGGRARDHATFTLDEVRLLAPLLHPPSIRVFDAPARFHFANPAAIVGPDVSITAPADGSRFDFDVRVAAVVGADGAIGGFTLMNDWVARDLEPPKDRDFATSLGPAVVTADELDGSQLELTATVNGGDLGQARLPDFDWDEAIAYGARSTVLRPGDPPGGAPRHRSAAHASHARAMSSRSKSSRSECSRAESPSRERVAWRAPSHVSL